jgi:hypothetical protein
MKRLNALRWSLSNLAVAGVATWVWAQDSAAPVVTATRHTVTATVQAIDLARRDVTVNGPDGVVSLQIDPSVERLNNVRVGDQVVVSYYEGVAARLVKGEQKLVDPAVSTFSYRTPGLEPGRGDGESLTETVTVAAINRTTNTVAFTRSDGSMDTIEIRSPNMREFLKTLNPGDVVEVTYTRSVAISVVPATADGPGFRGAQGAPVGRCPTSEIGPSTG